MQSVLMTLLFLLPAQVSTEGIARMIQSSDFGQATEMVLAIPGLLSAQETDEIIQAFRGVAPHGDSLPLLEAVADKTERNPQVLFFLAQAAWRAGDIERAMNASGEVFATTDDVNLKYRCAAIARTSQQLDIALERIEAILARAPRFDDALFLKASILVDQGKNDEARGILDGILERNGDHARSWYQLGLIDIREGNAEAALESLQRAVDAYPFFREAYGAMRTPLGRLKNKEALDAVTHALEQMRGWSGDHIAQLRVLHERGTDVTLREAEFLALEMMKLRQEHLALRYLLRYQDAKPIQDSTRLMIAHLAFNTRQYETVIVWMNKIESDAILVLDAYWGPYALSLISLGRIDDSRRIYKEYRERYATSPYFADLEKFFTEADKAPTPQQMPSPPGEGIRFRDVTEAAGLSGFQHRLGHPDKRWIVDAMGSGVAVGDYDNDGDDDIYFLNGQSDVMVVDPQITNALYRNDGGTFVDVTDEAGVGDTGVGMCAIFGDVNNDGRLDLFVGNYGANVLYMNNGDGTFRDATDHAGVGDEGYAAAATFGDADGDGDLDLYVGNYILFDTVRDGERRMNYHGQSVFFGPLGIDPEADVFYLNDGTGRFEDDNNILNTDDPVGRAMGAVFIDKENDGDLDLFVANDSTYNFFFENHANEGFEDISFFSGAAVNLSGRDVANMGIAVGDINRDGLLDFISTAYEKEPDNLYLNNGSGEFIDVSSQYGLGPLSYWLTTWGVGFNDFDADGQLDYYTVNGHVYPQVSAMEPERDYGQGVSIYRQVEARFHSVTDEALEAQVQGISGRGSALLDYDNDGDLDIVVSCIDGSPRLLENRSVGGNWFTMRIVGGHSIHGAHVVVQAGEESWTGVVDGGSSYLSQNASVIHFGLGDVEQIDAVRIQCNGSAIYAKAEPEINTVLNVKREDFVLDGSD